MLSLPAIARGVLVAFALLGAHGCQPMDPCRTHDDPTFVLGTGDTMFLGALVDGQDLKMERGPQGGCHLPLAFRTDGFVRDGLSIDYTLTDLDKAHVITTAGALVDVAPAMEAPHLCEVLAFRAFMSPGAMSAADDHIQIQVTVTDASGQSANKMVTVVARFPDVPASFPDPAHYCM
jgi:hypothetical protein